jgi:hypothetical protein
MPEVGRSNWLNIKSVVTTLLRTWSVLQRKPPSSSFGNIERSITRFSEEGTATGCEHHSNRLGDRDGSAVDPRDPSSDCQREYHLICYFSPSVIADQKKVSNDTDVRHLLPASHASVSRLTRSSLCPDEFDTIDQRENPIGHGVMYPIGSKELLPVVLGESGE